MACTEPDDYIKSLFLQPKMDGITMSQPRYLKPGGSGEDCAYDHFKTRMAQVDFVCLQLCC